jgi:hypothetical protein
MSDLLRDKRVLLTIFIVVGIVFYIGYRVGEMDTGINLTKGTINFSIDQSGMVDTENILVFAESDVNGNIYQEYRLKDLDSVRPVDLTEYDKSIKDDASTSFAIIYSFDTDPLTNEALYLKTDLSSSDVIIEEVTVYSAFRDYIKKYEQEPAKIDSYVILILSAELQENINGGIYLQYKGFVMDGLNRVDVDLVVFIQIIESG